MKTRGKKMNKTYSASDTVSCYGKKKQGSKLRRVGVGVILNRMFREIILQESTQPKNLKGVRQHDDLWGKSFLGRMVTRGKS